VNILPGKSLGFYTDLEYWTYHGLVGLARDGNFQQL
jgi:hypothetical protein